MKSKVFVDPKVLRVIEVDLLSIIIISPKIIKKKIYILNIFAFFKIKDRINKKERFSLADLVRISFSRDSVNNSPLKFHLRKTFYTISGSHWTEAFANLFITMTLRDWNSLSACVFPATYNLPSFKSCIHRYLRHQHTPPLKCLPPHFTFIENYCSSSQ